MVRIQGGNALVECEKYDFEKVYAAYERIVEAFTAAFGGGRSTVAVVHAPGRIRWPDPGKQTARETWEKIALECDVVFEGMIHECGPMTARAFLLGRTWCVYDPESNTVRTPRGDDIGALDAAPTVAIYGAWLGKSTFDLAAPQTVSRAVALVRGGLADLDLETVIGDELPLLNGGFGQLAQLRFPHRCYGAGRGLQRVRCVLPANCDPHGETIAKN